MVAKAVIRVTAVKAQKPVILLDFLPKTYVQYVLNQYI